LKGAEIASISPDVLIIESTHGVSKTKRRIDREFRFIHSVTRIVERGGLDLIPIFTLGKVQEFDDSFPCVVLAAPAMLQSGMNRILFDK
jgi:Cft2 family RNA processing exonuclease